jgi:hypothetical protein
MQTRQKSWLYLAWVLLIITALLWQVAPALAAPSMDDDNDQGHEQDKKPKKNDEQPAAQPGDNAPLIPVLIPVVDTLDTEPLDTGEVRWVFVNESKPGAPAPSGEPVQIGAEAPSGETAVRFTLNSAMQALAVQSQDDRLHGLRLADLSRLAYCTYLVDAPMPYAVMLQFNMDLDVTDANHEWQGRLVYEPARNGVIVQGEWQCWETLDGAWWATSGPLAGFATPTSPQPLSALLSEAPNLGFHAEYGALVLKAGDGWPRFDGYADGLLIGADSGLALFDFSWPNAAAKKDSNDKESDKANNSRDQKRTDRSPRPVAFDDKDDCKSGGWRDLGFRNQGQCVAYANSLANHPDLSR